jgi:hypothetical protein
VQESGSTRGHVRALWGQLGEISARAGMLRQAGERGAQGDRVSQRHWVGGRVGHTELQDTFKEPRNRVQGIDSASLCGLAGRCDNPIPNTVPSPP